MKRTTEIEIKVGVFVIVGVVLTCVILILVSGSKDIFQSKMHYKVGLPQVEGLAVGSLVKMAGFRVGQIDEMNIKETGDVELRIVVTKKYGAFVKQDSLAQLGTQGVLGDKYVNLTVGSTNSPAIADGGSIKAEATKEIKDYLSKGDQLIENLNKGVADLQSILGSFQREGRAENTFRNLNEVMASLAAGTKDMPRSGKALDSSMGHLNSIMAKVDRGDGTIGALINDQSLYDDLKALLGGANRNKVLKYFIKKSVEDSRDKAAAAEH